MVSTPFTMRHTELLLIIIKMAPGIDFNVYKGPVPTCRSVRFIYAHTWVYHVYSAYCDIYPYIFIHTLIQSGNIYIPTEILVCTWSMNTLANQSPCQGLPGLNTPRTSLQTQHDKIHPSRRHRLSPPQICMTIYIHHNEIHTCSHIS